MTRVQELGVVAREVHQRLETLSGQVYREWQMIVVNPDRLEHTLDEMGTEIAQLRVATARLRELNTAVVADLVAASR